jgi:hypothetical protein
MGKRGRYGLRLPERVGLEPEGDGTFGVADFTAPVADLRVTQFEATGDWMSNTNWIKELQSAHRLFELDNSNHDFNGVDETFERGRNGRGCEYLVWCALPDDSDRTVANLPKMTARI